MSIKTQVLGQIYSFFLVMLTFFAASALFLVMSSNAYANAVTITDQAGVLDAGKVRAEAATLTNPIVIFTTKTFGGDQEALNQATREQLTTQDAIAIEIDTVHRHMSVESGTQVQLSNDQASNAVSAFGDNFHEGDYTGATIAAIDAVRDDLTGSSITPVGMIVALLMIIGTLTLVFFIAFRWKRPPSDGARRAGTHSSHSHYAGMYHTGSYTGGSFGGGAGSGFGGGAGGSF